MYLNTRKEIYIQCLCNLNENLSKQRKIENHV